MAYSTLKLYKIDFKPEQLACLDNISDYLNSLTPNTITEFQYVRHNLDIQIKVDLYQSYTNNLTYNYISIKNNIDNRTYYYYITNYEWVSQNAVRLFLSMDDLNTFRDLIVFDDNTKIKRIHKDRYVEGEGPFYTRIVDKFPESLPEMPKFKGNDLKLTGGKKWYLVYCNAQGINVSSSDENDAINCYIVPESDEAISLTGGSYTAGDIITSNPPGSYVNIIVFTTEGVSITYRGSVYTTNSTYLYALARTSNGQFNFYRLTKATGELSNITTLGTSSDPIQFSSNMNSTAIITESISSISPIVNFSLFKMDAYTWLSEGIYTLDSIENVNRTLSYLVKIIECPYIPVDIQNAMDSGDITILNTTELNSNGMYALKLNNISYEFENEISGDVGTTFSSITQSVFTVDEEEPDKKQLYNESKLYHSDFFTLSYVYDSFVKNIPLENISFSEYTTTPTISVKYKQSNAISSSLLFDFTVNRGNWRKISNVENILICQRNNELPIFNSSYLNYIRNGYNFDVKSKNLKLGENIFSNVVGIAGGVAGLGASAVTGGFTAGAGISLLTSSIKGVASTILGDITNQYNIDRKIKEARATAIGVEGSEDLNLMNYYLGNKLHKILYEVSTEMKSYLYELFYKCGYATNEAGIPNITSRKNFNFLECEAEFTTRDNPEWKAYLEDVYEKFRKGVTFFHVYDDFLQQKENWEVWL